MSFKISCPHCMRTLNVSERAIGQTVPCPGCNQPITVPQSFQPARQTSDVAAPAWPGAAQNGDVTPPVAAPSLPPGMPPMPNGVPPPPADPLGFLRSDFVGGQVDGRQNLGDAGGAQEPPLSLRESPPDLCGSFSTGASAACSGLLAA